MKRFRAVECKNDVSHVDFDRKKSNCACGSPLVAVCGVCCLKFGYNHIKRHEERCRPSNAIVYDVQVVKFAYLQSDWELGEKEEQEETGFQTQPKGQYWDGLPTNLREDSVARRLRTHKVHDASMSDMEWMEAYDVLFAHVAADAAFELVRIFDWKSLKTLIWSSSFTHIVDQLKDIDILVVGNWIHNVVCNDGGDVSKWYARLRQIELDANCRVFPPLDYAMFFAHKEHYYSYLQRMLAAHPIHSLQRIPTTFISPTQRAWKHQAIDFAKKHTSSCLVFKRSISERTHHVQFVSQEHIAGCRLADRGMGGMSWLVQPKLAEFEQHNEIRLYFVGATFLWGVTSNFENKDGSISLFAFGKGRHGGEWSDQLVASVQLLVQSVISRLQTHARHFLRVDVIKSNEKNGMWYVNELEFFGNAFLHLEVMDDAYELFPVLVSQVKDWMKEL